MDILLITIGLLHLAYGMPGGENPCTMSNILSEQLYHPFPADKRMYIQCSGWGKAYIMNCPTGQSWNQQYQTCVDQPTKRKQQMPKKRRPNLYTRLETPRSKLKPTPPVRLDDMPQGRPYHPQKSHHTSSKSVHMNLQPVKSVYMESQPVKSVHMNSEPVKSVHMNSQPVKSVHMNSQPVKSVHMNSGPVKSVHMNSQPVKSEHMNSQPVKSEHMNSQPVKSVHMNSQPVKSMHINSQPVKSVHQPSNQQVKSVQTSSYKSHHEHSGKSNQGTKSSSKSDHNQSGGMQSGGINWPNPCNHPNIRYVPHPTNAQLYFECVNGVLEGNSCQDREVWIQPTHQCVNINERIGGSTSANPCLTSQQRFHPYPQDVHKYIECESWYQMKIWYCGKQAVWSQAHQSCVTLAPVQPTEPRTEAPVTQRPVTVPTTSSSHSMANFCSHSLSFYHPYKPDPSRFIQCDEYGNMYIRRCGPKKVWSDYYKTCVGSQGDAVNATMTSKENTDNVMPEPTTLKPTVSINIEPISFVEDMVQVTCPPEYQFNENTAMCEFVGNELLSDYNPFNPSCGEGYLWDTEIQMCVQALRIDEISNSPQMSLDFMEGLSSFDENTMPEYTGLNPCLSGENFYYPYPGDARYFLQCSLSGEVSVQSCPVGTLWSQQSTGLQSCVDWLVAVPQEQVLDGLESVLDADQLAAIAELSLDNADEAEFLKAINPCLIEDNKIHVYPLDPHRYISCSNGQPYLMLCAPGTVWNDKVNTCDRPSSIVDDS